MILGTLTNPGHSESGAWEEILAIVNDLIDADLVFGEARRDLVYVRNIAQEMLQQVKKGVHVNPGPHMASSRRQMGLVPQEMSRDVLAIIYRHVDDDEHYIHGFGDANLELKDKPDGTLTVRGLKDRTDVQMFAHPDGSVSLVGRHGQRLWEDM